jgi:ATP-dependent Clp protease ATP-binding subunit ClpA
VFERFTDRARRVVVLAQEESRLLDHNFIGTEHLLLGLVEEGEGVAAQALVALDIRLEAVRAQVEEIIGRGDSTPSGHIPFTPRAKKVLELALREALQLGHNYIGTEHILLGLVREGEGVAAQVLVKLGADLSQVRRQVVQILTEYQRTGVAAEHVGTTAVGGVADPAMGRQSAARGGELLEHALDRLVLRRFTVSSCRALLLAESEALRLGHPTVGVEHLLLGLLAEDEGRAAAALGAVGVDLAGARALAEESLGRGAAAARRPGYRDDALDVVEAALHEAYAAGAAQIDTEHLLLGVVHQAEVGPGRASGALGVLGTSPDAVRDAVAGLAPEPGGTAAGPDDAAAGQDDTAAGQDDTAAGPGGTAAGPDDAAAGRDDTAAGPDDTAAGPDDQASDT